MRINLIRHGMTAGNRKRQYIGITDQPLCEEGAVAVQAAADSGRMPACGILAVSPMRRCRQTAAILYPDVPQIVVDDFRECDFGAFECRSAEDMTGEPAFQAWIRGNGMSPFPGGDDPAMFNDRCCRAFAELLPSLPATAQTLTIVAHGGTIMAIMERYAEPHRPYYEWHVDNAQGYTARWDTDRLTAVERIGVQAAHGSREESGLQ